MVLPRTVHILLYHIPVVNLDQGNLRKINK